MTGLIPKEKLTAYQRWELAAFDEAERELAAESLPESPHPSDTDTSSQEPAVHLPTAEEVERIHTEAHETGFAAGFEEGIAQARANAEQIGTLLTNLQQALRQIDQEVAEQLLALAIEIADQVLRQSLRIKPELLLPVVREAVAALHHQHGHPALFVHPDDAALVRTQLGDQLAHNNWRIIEDATLSRGGCRVEVGASETDATLETRWRRVIEAIGVSQEWLDART